MEGPLAPVGTLGLVMVVPVRVRVEPPLPHSRVVLVAPPAGEAEEAQEITPTLGQVEQVPVAKSESGHGDANEKGTNRLYQ